MIKKVLPVIISIIITGCVSVPELTNPMIEKPLSSTSKTVSSYTLKSEQWWTELNDNNLNQLMVLILEKNKDLKLSNISILKLKEQQKLNNADKLPDVGLDASAKKQRLSGNSFNPPEYSNRIIDMDSLSLNTSYDLDFFDKIGHLNNQYLLQQKAEDLNKQWLILNISNQVVKLYAEYTYLKEDTLLLNNQKALYDNLLKLEKYKLSIGKSINENVLNLENEIKDINNSISNNETNIQLTMNSILILGNNDPVIEKLVTNKKQILYKENISMPRTYNSEIISERPDVKYYLYNIEAQKEKLKALKSDFYPSFSISGNLGFETITPSLLFSKSSLFATLAPSMKLPIFDSGRIKSSYKIAGYDLDTFIENYNSTLSKAVKDINDNLYELNQKEVELTNSSEKYMNEKLVFKNMENRYTFGKISNYDLIIEKNRIIGNERSNNQVILSRFNQKIDLINSLGGINIIKED